MRGMIVTRPDRFAESIEIVHPKKTDEQRVVALLRQTSRSEEGMNGRPSQRDRSVCLIAQEALKPDGRNGSFFT